MAVDFKKTLKHLYAPKTKPSIVNVEKANYIAVRGSGDPNDENSEYKQSISLLYPVAYAIKMSKKGEYKIPDYFDFVVPPLEGFWWQEGIDGVDYSNKQNFKFISLIRMPDFVTKEVFEWAIKQVTGKEKRRFLKRLNFLAIMKELVSNVCILVLMTKSQKLSLRCMNI